MTIPTITALPTPPSRNDPTNFATRADAFVAAFPTLVSEINAAGVAILAAASGTNYNATSSTSVTIGTGSKSFTASTGSLLQVGQWVIVASTASPANYMLGQVTAYNSGTGALTVNVTAVAGSGTIASWTIALAVDPLRAPFLAFTSYSVSAFASTPGVTPPTIGTTTGRYSISGKRVDVEIAVTVTAIGTGSGQIVASVPFTAAQYGFMMGFDTAISGNPIFGFIPASESVVYIKTGAGGFPAQNGSVLRLNGWYEIP